MSKLFKLGVVTIVLGLFFSSCHSSKKVQEEVIEDTITSDVPYIVAKGYFVKNSYTKPHLDNPKIASQEAFDQVFGMAPVMGEEGMPTAIDFATQDVMAIIAATTDKYTTLDATGVTQLQNKLTLHYKLTVGEKLTYRMQPCLIVVLDKKYGGEFSTDLQK